VLNRLTGAGVLVEDALFATLDPTVRRIRLPNGREITLADTVGFVRHLPHDLIEAFRSTLEEVTAADLILHVVDASDDDPEGQIAAVREVLSDIGASSVPELVVLNKVDSADPLVVHRLVDREPHSVVVSARTGAGFENLLAAMQEDLPVPSDVVDVVVPYHRGDLVARAHREGQVLVEEHESQGTRLRARVEGELAALLRRSDVSGQRDERDQHPQAGGASA
jgi:GTP-binding protein HflX